MGRLPGTNGVPYSRARQADGVLADGDRRDPIEGPVQARLACGRQSGEYYQGKSSTLRRVSCKHLSRHAYGVATEGRIYYRSKILVWGGSRQSITGGISTTGEILGQARPGPPDPVRRESNGGKCGDVTGIDANRDGGGRSGCGGGRGVPVGHWETRVADTGV